jgi:hypothetical protein
MEKPDTTLTRCTNVSLILRNNKPAKPGTIPIIIAVLHGAAVCHWIWTAAAMAARRMVEMRPAPLMREENPCL